MRCSTLTAVAAVLLIATPASAEDWDFVLINTTGKVIQTVELAPTGTTDWVPNQVDPEVGRLAPVQVGGRATIHFDKRADACVYDIRATFEGEPPSVWSRINVCDNSFVTLRFNASGATASTVN
jgi:hypothetical protein